MARFSGLEPVVAELNKFGSIMTLTELSSFLQVSKKVLRGQYEKGNLNLYRVGREGYQILTADVIEFLENNYNLGDMKNR